MEQNTRAKLSFVSLFIIFLFIVTFGNIKSNKILEQLDTANQQIQRNTELLVQLRKNLDQHHQISGKSSIQLKTTPIEKKLQNKAPAVVATSPIESNKVVVDNQPLTPDPKIDTDVERVECCDLDEWYEVQQIKIEQVLNDQIASGMDLSIDKIDCQKTICLIDLSLNGEGSVTNLAKTMSNLGQDKTNKIDLRSITREGGAVHGVIVIKQL